MCPSSNFDVPQLHSSPISDEEVLRLLQKMLVPSLAAYRAQLKNLRMTVIDEFGSRRLEMEDAKPEALSAGFLIDAETSPEQGSPVYAILFSKPSGLAELQLYSGDLKPISRQLSADDFTVSPASR
jgi:hypothetical protein